MTSITSPGESKKVMENSPFLEKLKKKGIEVLYMVDAINEYDVGDKVEKVIVSTVLWILPAVWSSVSMGGQPNMERIMKARALVDSSMASYMSSKKTMEINPENSIMEEPRKRADALIRMTSRLKIWFCSLFETALLTSVRS
ncbi:hypothetical protein IFM89_000043 [Coptis chinensis]|uniref:Uncharacterized protein n=1 Tax=Coptis chinensis TaxID=261450 RepID=A0A835IKR1_9MAGN|nr:hypothetical protein IFM89_000043 [Coptis chinensis]